LGFVFNISYFVLLVPAIRLIVTNRRLRWFGVALGLAAVLANGVFLFITDVSVVLARNVLAGALLFTATGVIFNDVLRPGKISWNKIMGAISVYLLIGFCFAFLFGVLDAIQPNAFSAQLAQSGGGIPDPSAPFLYYSFVTLTTLGYGDVLPLSAPARTLSWLEAVSGQLYLTVLVARLVGLHIVQAASERSRS
jgi:hypothetical protein